MGAEVPNVIATLCVRRVGLSDPGCREKARH